MVAAILNQFFLSSWEHYPDLFLPLPPWPLKGRLVLGAEPPSRAVLPRGIAHRLGTRPRQFWGGVPRPPGILELKDISGLIEGLLLDCTEVGVEAEAQEFLGPLSGQ